MAFVSVRYGKRCAVMLLLTGILCSGGTAWADPRLSTTAEPTRLINGELPKDATLLDHMIHDSAWGDDNTYSDGSPVARSEGPGFWSRLGSALDVFDLFGPDVDWANTDPSSPEGLKLVADEYDITDLPSFDRAAQQMLADGATEAQVQQARAAILTNAADVLVGQGVDSVEKLQAVINENPNFLSGVSQDDLNFVAQRIDQQRMAGIDKVIAEHGLTTTADADAKREALGPLGQDASYFADIKGRISAKRQAAAVAKIQLPTALPESVKTAEGAIAFLNQGVAKLDAAKSALISAGDLSEAEFVNLRKQWTDQVATVQMNADQATLQRVAHAHGIKSAADWDAKRGAIVGAGENQVDRATYDRIGRFIKAQAKTAPAAG